MTIDLTRPGSGPRAVDQPTGPADGAEGAPSPGGPVAIGQLPPRVERAAGAPPAGLRAVDAGAVALVPRVQASVGRLGTGLVAAVVSSLCCIPAALAFALGLGGSAALVGLTQYRPIFFATGVLGALVATWWGLRRSRRCCSPAEQRRNQLLIPALTLGTFGVSYLFINYTLLPWLYTLG